MSYTSFKALSKHLLVIRIRKSEISVRAAALAYHTILAIVPMVGLVFWYLKYLGVTKKWANGVKQLIMAQLNVSASETFADQFNNLTTSVTTSSWGYVGLAIFAFTSLSLISKLGQSLDAILDTTPDLEKFQGSSVTVFLKRALVFIVVPIAILISVALSIWLRKDSLLKQLFQLKNVGSWLALPIPATIDAIALFFVYRLVPQRQVKSIEAAKAALITAVLFEAAKYAMGEYNRNALMTQKLYGALSVIPVFIVWVQVAWMILLSGAFLIRLNKKV